jgi:hypothetical protein
VVGPMVVLVSHGRSRRYWWDKDGQFEDSTDD